MKYFVGIFQFCSGVNSLRKKVSPLFFSLKYFFFYFLKNQTTIEKLLESKISMASPHSIIFNDQKPKLSSTTNKLPSCSPSFLEV